jgi:hypothetical protein
LHLRAIGLFRWHLLFCPQNARRMAIIDQPRYER